MALSERAENIKAELQQVVSGKRELEALELELHDLLFLREEQMCDSNEGELPILADLIAERQQLRKRVAMSQLHNHVWLQHVLMTPLQRRVMRLRYVQGKTWGTISAQTDKSKQYLLREHNKVLERMAVDHATEPQNTQKTAERRGKTA